MYLKLPLRRHLLNFHTLDGTQTVDRVLPICTQAFFEPPCAGGAPGLPRHRDVKVDWVLLGLWLCFSWLLLLLGLRLSLRLWRGWERGRGVE